MLDPDDFEPLTPAQLDTCRQLPWLRDWWQTTGRQPAEWETDEGSTTP